MLIIHSVRVVSLPYWSRGSESATLVNPRAANLNMLGLGGSCGTQSYGPDGLTADVLVVKDFDELAARANEAVGKIVVFNEQCDWSADPLGCYGTSQSSRQHYGRRNTNCGTGFTSFPPVWTHDVCLVLSLALLQPSCTVISVLRRWPLSAVWPR
jgi:hypothetical protein